VKELLPTWRGRDRILDKNRRIVVMKLNDCVHVSESNRDLLLELVRIYVGVGLFFKGVFFLMNPALLAIPPGAAWLQPLAPAVPWIHIAGGLLLALGLLTRLAALSQIPILFAAVFWVHLPDMQQLRVREAAEFSALVLFLLVIIFFWGSGRLSLAERLGMRTTLVPARHEAWIRSHADLFADLTRVYLGVGLLIKGVYILQHQNAFMQHVNPSGAWPLALIIAFHYVIPAHFAGGALLAAGLLTRVAALAQLPLLLGAVFYLFLPRFATVEMRQNLEFSTLVLFLLTLFSFFGAGRYSVDQILRQQEQPSPRLKPAHSEA
jgi:putative oxidoreductase